MTFIEKYTARLGDSAVLVVLIAINAAMFVVTWFASHSGSALADYLTCPGSFAALAVRPWTLLTYMFVHGGPLHVIFNMLIFYWFGCVFMNTGHARQVRLLYLGGGIVGGLLHVAVEAIVGGGAPLAGSSAAVMALVVATAMLHADYRMNMLLFGEVSLRWVAVAILVIGMLFGGVAAHIGGALFGAFYALMLRRGRDLSLVRRRRRRKPSPLRPAAAPRRGASPAARAATRLNSRIAAIIADANADPDDRPAPTPEEELDEILDKVRRSGYASLSLREKKKLIEVSRTIGRDDRQ